MSNETVGFMKGGNVFYCLTWACQNLWAPWQLL